MTTTPNAKFDRILHLEDVARLTKNTAGFTPTNVSDFVKGQAQDGRRADQQRLMDALDALTADELQAFGEYRAARG